LRVSEAVGLKLEDISYLDGLPVSVIVTGKGDKQRRVPLSPTAKEALFRWLKHRQYRGTPTDRHVWISTAGRSKNKPLTIQAVWYIATIAAREAGVNKPASPHKYRHTFATQLRRSGRQLDEIRDLLGHSSISTTADIYARVDETHLVEAVNRLPLVQAGAKLE
jgi:integrase/recombinase XerD